MIHAAIQRVAADPAKIQWLEVSAQGNQKKNRKKVLRRTNMKVAVGNPFCIFYMDKPDGSNHIHQRDVNHPANNRPLLMNLQSFQINDQSPKQCRKGGKGYKALTVAQQLPSDFDICGSEGWNRELQFALQESASSHDRTCSANEIPKILQPFSTVLSLFDSCSASLTGECIFSVPVHSSMASPETR